MKIAIIEDSEFQRKIIRKALSSAGYDTVEAIDGKQAEEIVARGGLDLILLDLVLPDISGFDLLESFCKLQSSPPVIVLTADIQVTAKQKCKELGATEFLHKPVNATELIKAIESALC